MTYDHRVAGTYEALWRKIEAAIESHPLWGLADRSPAFLIDRNGCEARVIVRRHGKGRVRELFGKGPTPEAATDSLIGALDYWAEH